MVGENDGFLKKPDTSCAIVRRSQLFPTTKEFAQFVDSTIEGTGVRYSNLLDKRGINPGDEVLQVATITCILKFDESGEDEAGV